MNSIIERINKLLALGERGGTEAEATAAMQKVHALLAKHNLSMDDVKEAPIAAEDYVRQETGSAPRQPWQDWIWGSIAELYFCRHFKRHWCGEVTHLLIGKPSNIAVVKFVATYVVRTGEELARKSGSGLAFRNSFKKGFAYRIVNGAKEEIAISKAAGLTDSETGTPIVLAPLYDQSRSDIDRFILQEGMKPRSQSSRAGTVSDRDGFLAGRQAADLFHCGPMALDKKPSPQSVTANMTLDDPMWDDLWHGVIWAAFVAQAVGEQRWPDPEKTRQRAYKLFEDEKRKSLNVVAT